MIVKFKKLKICLIFKFFFVDIIMLWNAYNIQVFFKTGASL